MHYAHSSMMSWLLQMQEQLSLSKLSSSPKYYAQLGKVAFSKNFFLNTKNIRIFDFKQIVGRIIFFQLTLSTSFSNVQNFYLLKIHLNLIEISNRVLEFESLISI